MLAAESKALRKERLNAARKSPMPAILAANSKTEGDLVTDGEVRLEGRLVGDFKGTAITVGRDGSMQGMIVADTAEIGGHFEGKIKARHVVLTATARVVGTVDATESLNIEPGATIEGQVKRVAKEAKPANSGSGGGGGTAKVVPVRA